MKDKKLDALSEAALHGDAKSIRTLLSQPSVAKDRKCLELALGHAAEGGHGKAVELLLKAGADPDSKAVSNSLLIGAAESGYLDVVKLLTEAGANIHRKVAGSDAFSAALEMDEVKVAEYLKSRGANWATPTLRYATERGDLAMVQKAVAAGADLESSFGNMQETALMSAASAGYAKVVRFLLQKGANPNKRVEGRTAIYVAAAHGNNVEVIESLFEAGANVNDQWYGTTILMAAAESGCLPVVKKLVELGAKIQARDKEAGKSVMDFAKLSKSREVIAYLKGLGVTADRDAGRTFARTLAGEFGGKTVEHTHGFMLNSRFAGSKCQVNILADYCAIVVFGLKYIDADLQRAKNSEIIFSPGKPESRHGKVQEVKSARRFLRVGAYRSLGNDAVPEKFVSKFCAQHQNRFRQLALADNEFVGINGQAIRFAWVGMDINALRPRLQTFASLIQEISKKPGPEERLFEKEWLLKPLGSSASRSVAPAHSFGGKLDRAVACPQCGNATNLMAQLDLSDPALSKTVLGRRKLPVFWCLTCLEWSPVFYDISGDSPTPLDAKGKALIKKNPSEGEKDLSFKPVALSIVPDGKKAGRKSKVGGVPSWIQLEEIPECPKCEFPMSFVLQLVSDSRISFGDMGVLYAFACPGCQVTASLVQSH